VPAVCRGDLVDEDIVHCSVPRRDECSTNVFVNGTGISREEDHNNIHVLPGVPCPPHTAPITIGSATVIINGKGCGRIGDLITSCTRVATGSSNVFAGPAIV
jgi:uncharacterized Zn-binding protein involved in type VI secretion